MLIRFGCEQFVGQLHSRCNHTIHIEIIMITRILKVETIGNIVIADLPLAPELPSFA
jgi:hypothetical protein